MTIEQGKVDLANLLFRLDNGEHTIPYKVGGYMDLTNRKGQECIFRPMLCQEGVCSECQVAIDACSQNCRICATCGADTGKEFELTGKPHMCRR